MKTRTIRTIFYPLLFRLIVGYCLILSGCISQKVQQQSGIVGDLFREESTQDVPFEVEMIVNARRNAYENMNDFSFVKMREDFPNITDAEFDNMMDHRHELSRLNAQNEILLSDLKALIHPAPAEPFELNPNKLSQRRNLIREKIKMLFSAHYTYMDKNALLNSEIDPYKPSFINKFILY